MAHDLLTTSTVRDSLAYRCARFFHKKGNAMQCPVCSIELVMAERQGVEIDYCPQCRGVWLDRGELDKILEKSASIPGPAGSSRSPEPLPRRDDDDRHERRGKRRESFWSELFDFG